MIRRIVCLLLVPAMLANQAAMCCAHQHHDSEVDSHSTRTHFHVSGQGTHNHHHGDSSEHEHSGESAPDRTESSLGFDLGCPLDHDGDAIFIGEQCSLHSLASRMAFKDVAFISICFASEPPRAETRGYRSHRCGAAPFLQRQCALYLQTGRLLI